MIVVGMVMSLVGMKDGKVVSLEGVKVKEMVGLS